MSNREVVILSSVRTAIGDYGGSLKDVAPSDDLRRWFHRDPATRWPEFRRRYFAELNRRPTALCPILDAARRGPVTLLFAARDVERNHAAALRDYLLGDRPVSEGKNSVVSRSH